VTPLLVWIGLAASFVLGLAAVVRMSGAIPDDGLRGVIRLPAEVTATIATLFALAVVIFVADLVRRGWSRRSGEGEMEDATDAQPAPPWVRALRQLLTLAYFCILAYALSRAGVSIEGLLALGAGAGSAGAAFPRGLSESAPPLITWTFGILALAAGAGALALALWAAMAGRQRRDEADRDEPVSAPLEAAVDESLEDLRDEPDARRAIVRCYARFERAAADSGLARQPWATPAEFMREALARLPVPRTAVPTLTGLFERARFSDHALGRPERDQAVSALDEIRAAIAATRSDAAPS